MDKRTKTILIHNNKFLAKQLMNGYRNIHLIQKLDPIKSKKLIEDINKIMFILNIQLNYAVLI